jgi:hypothetical protein
LPSLRIVKSAPVDVNASLTTIPPLPNEVSKLPSFCEKHKEENNEMQIKIYFFIVSDY